MENLRTKQTTVLNVYQIVIAVFPLLLGALIYILWRPHEPVFIDWLNISGVESVLASAQTKYSSLSRYLPGWIIYSLPAGLWAFSYSFVIIRIWYRNNSFLKYFWISTIPVLILGVEIFQLAGFLPGTFCLVDIAFSTGGIAAGYAIVSIVFKPFNNHEK